MYNHILLAADGSDHAFRAGKQAAQLAKASGGKVDVVYVVDGETSKADNLNHSYQYVLEKKRREKLKRVELVLKEEKTSYNIVFLHGEPGPAIIKHANNKSYDCLVIGSRGLNNLQSLVLGSVSHKVAKRVSCPVMIVK